MKVVNIDPINEQKKRQREELCEILDEMKKMVSEGQIDEFVAASICNEGTIQIHAVCKDFIGGVGLFEIGKKIFIDQKED